MIFSASPLVSSVLLTYADSETDMMNTKILALILSGAFLMSGCSLINRTPAPDLPAGAPSFTQDSNGTGEAVINYNGREYAFFGTLKNSMSNDSLRECIGYVGDDKNERIYTLMEDTFDNYIMVKNTNGVMDQPGFYRATDTKNKDILTPSYIESLGYESWGSSGLHYEERTAVIGVVCEADNIIEIGYSIDINGENSNIGGVRYGIQHHGREALPCWAHRPCHGDAPDRVFGLFCHREDLEKNITPIKYGVIPTGTTPLI